MRFLDVIFESLYIWPCTAVLVMENKAKKKKIEPAGTPMCVHTCTHAYTVSYIVM